MNEEKEITPVLSTSDIIDSTIIAVAEGITGIAASDKEQWFLSIGHLLQRIRSGRFLQTLKEEWEDYREQGRVEDDYLLTDQHQECLQELLDFLDQDSPDEIRFTVLMKIFLTSATESISDRNSVLPQQYMKVSRSLSSGEVLILFAAYEIVKNNKNIDSGMSASVWLADIAKVSGLKYPELVETYETDLIEKNLLTPRTYNDRSGVSVGEHFRLTSLAWDLCQFLEEYDRHQDQAG